MVAAWPAKLGPRVAPSIRARQREKIGHRLDLAGRPGGMTVQRFIGLKAALATLVGGGMLLLMLAGGTLLLVLPALFGGWFAPDVWLSREGRLRQERIERELPDFLDILAVTVRAGLGYRAALSRVSQELGGPLGEEMLTALRQMELGASRRQAFLALRDRSSSESLATFVAAQLQAEELGVPLSAGAERHRRGHAPRHAPGRAPARVPRRPAGEPHRHPADRARARSCSSSWACCSAPTSRRSGLFGGG